MPDNINIYDLSETDIRTKYITPAIQSAGWDIHGYQVLEEYPITDGRIMVGGHECYRAKPKKADYVLFYRPNKPIAVIEAKDANHNVGDGMQQALGYAAMLDVPFVFSSNGLGFRFHNRYVTEGDMEINLPIDGFPSPETLWEMYKQKEGYTEKQLEIINQQYYSNNPNKKPRYYQINAINKVVEAIAADKQNRFLLVMATGTGKTYTAFQIIWRLWKARVKKRILFLTDRKALAIQTYQGDFSPFGDKMILVDSRNVDTAHEVYIALYQRLTGEDKDDENYPCFYEQFSQDFFDLVIVDECHRGSAREDSQWRKVLEYFSSATQIGLTATPKETTTVSNIDYFGEPIYTYSLKQGIADGFLAPYRVIRIFIDVDITGYTPSDGEVDDHGLLLDKNHYAVRDYDRELILNQRTKIVAKKVSDYLKQHNCRMDKTIFFCVDQEHADRMRQELVNENADLCHENDKYVMRMTADDDAGVQELDNFRNPQKDFPVLVTTSKLLSTGVDIKTLKYIVLDSEIGSMTEFKQIIGRGSRLMEEFGKMYFTIFDFRDVTTKFFDPAFDETPIVIHVPPEGPIDNTPPKPKKKSEKRTKLELSGVPAEVSYQIEQFLDENGKLVLGNYLDYTRQKVQGKYASMSDFLNAWNSAERKTTIVDELLSQGIIFSELQKEVGKDLDPFDLILHIVFDQPPLTRRERAENVRKRNYFTKYGKQAAAVLDALLTKYADNGIKDIEDIDVLRVDPISRFGSLLEVIQIFGSKARYYEALRDLENAIYSAQ